MKKTNFLESLEPEAMYHIYNRGINGTNLFYKHENYSYFLSKYAHYLGNLLDTFAYCLLGNHFHMLVRVKDLTDLNEDNINKEGYGLHHPDKIVSKKFSDFFNSYTKSINKAIGRTGGLFETPFKRIKIDNPLYFSQVLTYIHFNPQKHGFIDDFREYEYSSYQSHLTLKPTKLMRQDVLKWFGNSQEFKDYHKGYKTDSKLLNKYIIEFD